MEQTCTKQATVAPQSRPSSRFRFVLVQVLTLARVPLAMVFSALLMLDDTIWSVWGCVIILAIIELTDLFDGMLARRFKVVSEWGAMLDPYSDSVSRLIVYWGLAVSGRALAFVPLAMAARDVTVAYARILIAKSGGSVSAKWSGKIKAVFQGVGAILIVLNPIYARWIGDWAMPAISWVVTAVTLGSLIEYVQTAIRSSLAKHETTHT